ncbi:MAG: FKBP-type peptidyl-prolyl cis-trans isomerase [Bacteroidales bacterium]|nr:FKBP-type peptidyl-prolyl cis-trans isomerase [Bacteroidales bacterium]
MKKYFLLTYFLIAGAVLFAQISEKGFETTKSGLKYKITEKGKGIKPKDGDKVQVHYTGKFTNDSVFDSSVTRGTPFEFELGAGQVIKGWDEGIALLNEGSKATFIIPSDLAYGPGGRGTIPPNSTLVFDVELIKVTPGIRIEPYKWEKTEKNTTESGLTYYIVEKNPEKSTKAGYGKTATVQYSAFLENGKMFDSSVKRNQPAMWELGTGPLKGFDEGISYMSVGDKYRLQIPAELAFGNRQIPNIPAGSTIYIDVELLNVVEPVKIEPFVTQGLDTVKTKSGLQYIVVEKTEGKKAKFGKSVKVHYTGYLDDGSIFDSSVKRGQPIDFTLGVGKVIAGWDEGVALMKQGEKFRLIIPYNLAYGEQGKGGIPPKARLTFDVELVDVGY